MVPAFIASESYAGMYLCHWVLEIHKIDAALLYKEAETNHTLENITERFKKCKEFNNQFPKFVMTKAQKHALDHKSNAINAV